jgi:GNAT superfamily N-acetyltransferase
MSEILEARDDGDVRRCHAVMRQLRPHVDEDALVERVRRQRNEAYRLVFVERDGAVVAVAGFRIAHNLAWGRFLYVDDLVTDGTRRSTGHGTELLDWMVTEARRRGCDEFHLDSGVQRFGAHRFYLRHGLDITSHHFALRLGAADRTPPATGSARR